MDRFFQSCPYPAVSDIRRTFESLARSTTNLEGQQPLSAASAQDAVDTDRDLSFYQSHDAVSDISGDRFGSAARLSALGMVGESGTIWRNNGTLSQRYPRKSKWQTEELQSIQKPISKPLHETLVGEGDLYSALHPLQMQCFMLWHCAP